MYATSYPLSAYTEMICRIKSSPAGSEMFSNTPMNFVLSWTFAGLALIEIGSPVLSTATCIFVPRIFLNPSYPVLPPLFWRQLMMNQLIFFPGWFFPVCVQILSVLTESFSTFPFAAALRISDARWILNRICPACLPTCSRLLVQTIFR